MLRDDRRPQDLVAAALANVDLHKSVLFPIAERAVDLGKGAQEGGDANASGGRLVLVKTYVCNLGFGVGAPGHVERGELSAAGEGREECVLYHDPGGEVCGVREL